jgi:catabolite regulation protein CreA
VYGTSRPVFGRVALKIKFVYQNIANVKYPVWMDPCVQCGVKSIAMKIRSNVQAKKIKMDVRKRMSVLIDLSKMMVRFAQDTARQNVILKKKLAARVLRRMVVLRHQDVKRNKLIYLVAIALNSIVR